MLLSVTESVFTESGQSSCCKSGTRYSGGPPSACSEGRRMTRGCDRRVLLELPYPEMQRDRMPECRCKNLKSVLTEHWRSTSRRCRRGKSRARNSILHIAAESPVSFRTSSLSGELRRVDIVKEMMGAVNILLHSDEKDSSWLGVVREGFGNDVT